MSADVCKVVPSAPLPATKHPLAHRSGVEMLTRVLPPGTHPASVRALTRHGLVAGGCLTPLAVDVYAALRELDDQRRKDQA